MGAILLAGPFWSRLKLDRWAQQAKNKALEADAAAIRLRAEMRLGDMMKEQWEVVGKNRGTAGAGRPKLGGSVLVPPKTGPLGAAGTLAEAGIDKHLADRARKAAAIPVEKLLVLQGAGGIRGKSVTPICIPLP